MEKRLQQESATETDTLSDNVPLNGNPLPFEFHWKTKCLIHGVNLIVLVFAVVNMTRISRSCYLRQQPVVVVAPSVLLYISTVFST